MVTYGEPSRRLDARHKDRAGQLEVLPLKTAGPIHRGFGQGASIESRFVGVLRFAIGPRVA